MGKKKERKKREKRLRKGTDLFICFLECLEHLVLLATRNHFCCAKGFTHELKPKVFFVALWEEKTSFVQFCELQTEISL